MIDADLIARGRTSGVDFGLTPGTGVGYDRIEVCVALPEDLSDIRAGLAAANASLGVLQSSVDDVAADVAVVQTGVDDANRKADEILALLRGRDRQEIEWKLYNNECVPTLWLPAAQGGMSETAQSVAANLVAAARASGDSGVNVRLAEAKLASASESFADAEYQRTCKLLVDAVKAIGTP
jgi:hypothetical protein